MADIAHVQLNDTVFDIKDSSARSDVTNIMTRLSALENPKVLIISDSYGVPVADTGYPVSNGSFIDRMINAGLNVVKAANGGAGFTVLNNTFLNLLNSVSDDPEITDILVAGGINDRDAASADIRSAIVGFCSAAKIKFPSAKIHIAGISNCTNAYQYKTVLWNTIFPAYATAPADYVFVPHAASVLYDTNMIGDVHPNEAGQEALYRFFRHYLFGRGTTGFISDNITETLTLSGTTQNSLFSKIINDTCYVYPAVMNQTSITNLTITPYQFETKIGTVGRGVLANGVQGNSHQAMVLPCTLLAQTGGTWYNFNGYLRFTGGDVYLNIDTPSTGFPSAITYSQVYLRIIGGSFPVAF